MASEDKNAFAAVARSKVVLESFIAREGSSVFGRVAGHLAELGKQPAEVAIEAAKDLLAFGGRSFGKGELKVGEANFSQAAEDRKGHCADDGSHGSRPAAWHCAKKLDQDPYDGKFQAFSH
jgi:hypothetical protein